MDQLFISTCVKVKCLWKNTVHVISGTMAHIPQREAWSVHHVPEHAQRHGPGLQLAWGRSSRSPICQCKGLSHLGLLCHRAPVLPGPTKKVRMGRLGRTDTTRTTTFRRENDLYIILWWNTVRPVLKGNPRFSAKGYVNCSQTQFSYCGSLAHSIMYKNYSWCLARL